MVFDMHGDSVAGPDGYSRKFFTFAWDIIAQDTFIMQLLASSVVWCGVTEECHRYINCVKPQGAKPKFFCSVSAY